MIAKNIKGKSFAGCVRYVISESAKVLKAEGIFADCAQSVIDSFKFQQSQRSEIKRPVGHIPIAFSPEDKAKMSDEFMTQVAEEYMDLMGIRNTQYIIVRHNNTDHDHLHVIYNRIDNDLKLISVNNDYQRNVESCKMLKDRYGLTYGEDKSKVKREKLHGSEQVKYLIHDVVLDQVKYCKSIDELVQRLRDCDIDMELKYRRGSDVVQGVSFIKNEYRFKASQVDRKLSYANLEKIVLSNEANHRQELELQRLKDKSFLEAQRIADEKNAATQQRQRAEYEQQQAALRKAEEERRRFTPLSVLGVKITHTQWVDLQMDRSIVLLNMNEGVGKLMSGHVALKEDGKSLRLTMAHRHSKRISYDEYMTATNIANIQPTAPTPEPPTTTPEQSTQTQTDRAIMTTASALGSLFEPDHGSPYEEENEETLLRKKDLQNGVISYRRRKTGQQLHIKWERCMQQILDRYPLFDTDYLLPIITNCNKDDRAQYRNSLSSVNNKLKKIGEMLGLSIPLTQYVARHSWASVAKSKNIPISVISEGMGHDSETTTQIYLASLDTSIVDKANNLILKLL